MKQILQNLQTGITEVLEVPCPQIKPGHLLINTHFSLISAGTERMLLEFSQSNLLNKARQQPDKVKMVINKIKTDGLQATMETVKNKLDTAIPMGYCNAGKVIEVGKDVTGIAPGDWVVSNGFHAEQVLVPKNLCVKIPEGMQPELAPFAVLGAIGLQGIRLANPGLGEQCGVIGLGLIGLLTAQLLRAQGCRVIGFDYDEERLALAEQFGIVGINLAKDLHPVDTALAFSRGYGLDAVFIATATQSQDPLRHAAQMSRKRGKVILLGISGLELSRADFYEKELSFQVSCSYGPGRYDHHYEELGHDYPYPFVRWTERRNIEAVLDIMMEKRLDVAPLISHRFEFSAAAAAYALLADKKSSLGVLLEYPQKNSPPSLSTAELSKRSVRYSEDIHNYSPVKIGFIGAGNFAGRVLIPAFCKTPAQLAMIAGAAGINCALAARKYRIPVATTQTDELLADNKINTVVIATRHNNHAQLVCAALAAGKHVYVEKPLCLNINELKQINQAVIDNPAALLMVGFNRRFSPLVDTIKSLLNQTSGPKSLVMTVNAGKIPANHWTQDRAAGGGRIIGECCHFIDLLRYLTGHSISAYSIYSLQTDNAAHPADTATIQLKFADQSIGAIHYFANGHRSLAKERLEIFCDGQILQLDNFRRLTGYGWPKFRKQKLWRQDKGHEQCAAHFVQSIINGKVAPIPFAELYEVAATSIFLAEALEKSPCTSG